MTDVQSRADAVLQFWFEELAPENHFRRDDGVDHMIRTRFGDLHTELSQGVPEIWLDDPQATLAAVIVLDQFSRNLYRDDGRAFASDAEALRIAKMAVARGDLDTLSDAEAYFMIMPFMHAEDVATIETCIALFKERLPGSDGARYAKLHRDSVARFGRYPARNAALGRDSTQEEIDFLKENPAGF